MSQSDVNKQQYSEPQNGIITGAKDLFVSRCISLGYIIAAAGAVLVWLLSPYAGIALWQPLYFLAMATLLEGANRSKLEINSKIRIQAFVAALIIPSIIFSFGLYESKFIWSVSFLCMIFSLITADSTMMKYSAFSLISTQLFVWGVYHAGDGGYNKLWWQFGLLVIGILAAFWVDYRFRKNLAEKLNHNVKVSGQSNEIERLSRELESSRRELIAKKHKIDLYDQIMREDKEIYRLMLETTSDGIWYVSPSGSYFSPRLKQLANHTDELDIEEWRSLIHEEDSDEVRRTLDNHLHLRTDSYKCVYRISTGNGDYRWLSEKGKTLFDGDGDAYFKIGALSDITDLKQHEEMLDLLAYHDILTGLPNRMLFFDKLGHAVRSAVEQKKKFAVVFIDLDNFKRVNDSQGHFAGDALIEEVATRLKNIVDEHSVMGRLGGDEFALVVSDIYDREQVLPIIMAMKECLQEPFDIYGKRVFVSASFGIAVFPDDGEEPVELLRNADTAMYKAKELGKNHFQFFRKSMKEDIVRKTDIEYKLKNAIMDEELSLRYQPQFSLDSNQIRGFEALLRWNNPSLGEIMPLEFISIAEETGLIIPVGEWVLKNACHTMKGWQDKYGADTIISVNISPAQLKDQYFIETVRRVLCETGLKPESLELEITESVCIESVNKTVDILTKIKEMGVKISLDDFGTGFSSLSYLKLLPIDTLKIDKSFIQELQDITVKNEIVEAVISLVQQLRIDVIAEGVETERQLNYLKAKNCKFAQGFLLGKPVPVNEVDSFYKA